MRPINKGESPYKKINEYKDALPYLERRIGMYCSYCEFSIPHVPEVEHVVSKSKGGDLTDWNNLNHLNEKLNSSFGPNARVNSI